MMDEMLQKACATLELDESSLRHILADRAVRWARTWDGLTGGEHELRELRELWDELQDVRGIRLELESGK